MCASYSSVFDVHRTGMFSGQCTLDAGRMQVPICQ